MINNMETENIMKICSKCNELKNICEFGYDKKGKYFTKSICKICKRKADNLYITKNKIKVKASLKNYHNSDKGKETLKKASNKWRVNNKEKHKTSSKNSNLKYRINNKNKINNWFRLERKNNPIFKISANIRSSISTSLRENNYTKKSKTTQILGCSFDEFKTYIESKFQPWMNWDNYGLYNAEPNYGWDIDHIIPTTTAFSEEELLKLNHYTNLQPLCSYINRVIKRDN